MNSFIIQQQAFIQQLRKSDPNIDIIQFFDQILVVLNNNPIENMQILTSICSELANFVTVRLFHQSQIMKHEIFIRISHLFRMLLTKITYSQLTKQEEQCFDAMSSLIFNLCSFKNRIITSFFIDNNEYLNPKNKTKINLSSYGQIFFTELFVQKYVRLLKEDICMHEYEPYHVKYKVINRLLCIFTKLNDVNHILILDAVLQCITSEPYRNLYKTMLINQPTLTPKQLFFMYQCPKYICLRQHRHDDKHARSLCKSMIEYGMNTNIFHEHLLTEKSHVCQTAIARSMANYIELLNHFALIPNIRSCFLEKTMRKEKSMIDQIIEIIECNRLIKNAKECGRLFNGDVALISYSVTLLYNLTFETKIFEELKSKNVIDICKDLSEMPNKTVEFAARTLVAFLEREKIDKIEGPTEIARSYLYMIENTIDDITLTFHGIKLDGVLTNLEEIVQNDEVKEEIINDDEGIPILAQCAYRSDFDVETIQKPALRIIGALSFASEYACEQIKDNDLLMDHIRELIKRKNDQQLLASQLVWKVQEEEVFISKQDPQIRKRKQNIVKRNWDESKAIYQYIRGDFHFHLSVSVSVDKFDIVLSFDERDKQIADEIHKYLQIETDFSISSGKIFPEPMARAVESSTIVILCLSSKYRHSYTCRLEAEYAKKRSKAIIPVIIEKNYEPSGWVENVVENETVLYDFHEELLERIAHKYEDEQNKLE